MIELWCILFTKNWLFWNFRFIFFIQNNSRLYFLVLANPIRKESKSFNETYIKVHECDLMVTWQTSYLCSIQILFYNSFTHIKKFEKLSILHKSWYNHTCYYENRIHLFSYFDSDAKLFHWWFAFKEYLEIIQ